MHKFISLLCLSLLLTACGGSDGGGEQSNSSQPSSGSGNTTEVTPVVTAVITGNTANLLAGDLVRLSAQQSANANVTAAYSWSFAEKPTTSSAKIAINNTANLQFVADIAGDYKVNLTVTAGSQTQTRSVLIKVAANQPPTLKLQTPQLQNVLTDKPIRLDASASLDPEMRALQFGWQVLSEPAGSQLALLPQSQVDVTPIVAGDYKIKLTLHDGVNQVTDVVAFTAYKSIQTLKADAAATATAAQQVTAFFGEGSLDLPEQHAAEEHLQIASDPIVGPHFIFTLHTKQDGDRELPFAKTDRQRAEMKSFSQSPDPFVCRLGDRMEVDFSMKMDNIQLSTSFTHLFQLKGKDDMPLFTLSAQKTASVTALRLNHLGADNKLQPLAAVPWEQVNDRWLAISLRFSCAQQGYLEALIKNKATGSPIYLEHKSAGIRMWQDVSHDVYGIKTGLYRKIKDDCSPAQATATISCDDPAVMKKEFSRLQDSVRIAELTIRKL
jgi:hypothetical protein